jgi:GxxExxY protein
MAIEVHRELGPGLLQSVYEHCLCKELSREGVPFRRQVELPVVYKGERLPFGYQMDIVVDPGLIIEVKAVACLMPVHEAQLLTYLRLSGYRVGLLINFHSALLKDGIRRMVL